MNEIPGQGVARRTSAPVQGAVRKTVGVRCIARFLQVTPPGYPHGRGEVPAPRRIRGEVFRPGGRRLGWEFARAGLTRGEGDRDRGGPATLNISSREPALASACCAGRPLASPAPAAARSRGDLPHVAAAIGMCSMPAIKSGHKPSRRVRILRVLDRCPSACRVCANAVAPRGPVPGVQNVRFWIMLQTWRTSLRHDSACGMYQRLCAVLCSLSARAETTGRCPNNPLVGCGMSNGC